MFGLGSCGPLGSSAAVTFLLLLGQCISVAAQCTPPLSGSWYRASDKVVITFTGPQVRGHKTVVNSNAYDDYSCWQSSGSKYVFRQEALKQGPFGKFKGYFCWQIVPISSSTAFLYQLTSIHTGAYYTNQRAAIVDEGDPDPSFSTVCSLNPAVERPTLLYKVSSSAASDVDVTTATKQQCPADTLATYSYVKAGQPCSGTVSELDFCADRQTAHVQPSCNDNILFSAGGNLSCVASFTRGGDIFLFLLNEDSTVSGSNTRFTCLKVTESNGAGSAVAFANDCDAANTNHTLSLIRQKSCPVVEGGSEGTDIIPIVIGVVVGVVVIVAVVVALFMLYKKGIIGRNRRRVITPTTAASKPMPAPGEFSKPPQAPPSQNGTTGVTTDTSNGAAVKTQPKLPPIQSSASGATTTPAENAPLTSPSKLPPITQVNAAAASANAQSA